MCIPFYCTEWLFFFFYFNWLDCRYAGFLFRKWKALKPYQTSADNNDNDGHPIWAKLTGHLTKLS